MNFVVDAQLQKAESFQISQNTSVEDIINTTIAYLAQQTKIDETQIKKYVQNELNSLEK